MALRNTRNAARLVQSLGDLAQLDEPEFKLRSEVVDAGELLDDICLRFADRAAQCGVTVDVERPAGGAAAPAALDIELFERAIANLVDNAFKFCAPGARITLAAAATEEAVRISVSDTGPGIAPADVPHLFDRFYQSRQSVAPATGVGGKGLGLAIVKRIAELHGGEVSVSSVLHHGTTVVLSLPAIRGMTVRNPPGNSQMRCRGRAYSLATRDGHLLGASVVGGRGDCRMAARACRCKAEQG